MTYVIQGLDPAPFRPLFGLSDVDLAARGAVRRTADARPGYPCRVSLQDAEPGQTLLLLHHQSHGADTPYRSAYAIFVSEAAEAPARYVDELPPVLTGRPIALRLFDRDGMLAGADLATGDVDAAVRRAFARSEVAYIHAHNAAHGCFAAEIRRG